MGVWEMRCVGYDVDFQKEIAERFKTWTPPPRKPRKTKKGKEKEVKPSKKASAGTKRKRAEMLDSSSESGSDEEVIVLDDSDS